MYDTAIYEVTLVTANGKKVSVEAILLPRLTGPVSPLNIEVNVNKYGSQGQRVNSPFRRRFKRHSMDEIMEFLGLQTEAQKGEMIYMTALLNGKEYEAGSISSLKICKALAK